MPHLLNRLFVRWDLSASNDTAFAIRIKPIGQVDLKTEHSFAVNGLAGDAVWKRIPGRNTRGSDKLPDPVANQSTGD